MSNPEHSSFYISAIDGPKRYLVAGPYGSHQAALELVRAVRTYAEGQDARACFMAWGTASSAAPMKTPMGAWSPENEEA